MYQHIVFVSLHNFPSDINTIDENGNGLFYPLYIAPRSPWNNGQVEGFNSVFSKKFWNKRQFNDEQEIDVKIKDFNIAYEKYSRLVSNDPELKEKDLKDRMISRT